jgi:hypothetical protein
MRVSASASCAVPIVLATIPVTLAEHGEPVGGGAAVLVEEGGGAAALAHGRLGFGLAAHVVEDHRDRRSAPQPPVRVVDHVELPATVSLPVRSASQVRSGNSRTYAAVISRISRGDAATCRSGS